MRKTLDRNGKLLAKYTTGVSVRGRFYRFMKVYCKLCQFKHKKKKSNLIEKLDNFFETDPKHIDPC